MKLIFDIETDGLYEECTTTWIIVARELGGAGKIYQFYNGTERTSTPKDGSISDALRFLSEASQLIGHNIIEYDIPVLRKLFGFEPNPDCQVTDTLVLSRLFNPDRPGGHGLGPWGDQLGFPKGDHDDWTCLSAEMIKYCVRDVNLNYAVYEALKKEIRGQRWGESIQLEHDVATIISQQQVNGVYFDGDLAIKTVHTLGSVINDVDAKLVKELPFKLQTSRAAISKPFRKDGSLSARAAQLSRLGSIDDVTVGGPFQPIEFIRTDLGSDKQVKEWLLSIGWQPTEFTPAGGPKLTEDSFDSLPDKQVGKLITERVQARHRLGQITGWVQSVRPDGRITAGANTIGTPTGRMRHRTVVNVPAVGAYMGEEMRAMFAASDSDYVIVGHDASGLELRMLAHYMNDSEYTEILLNGDIHSHNQELAGLHTRSSAKTFILKARILQG